MSFFKGTMTIFGMAFTLLACIPVSSAAILESQRLNFGRWYVQGNSSVETITVSPLGAVSTSTPNLIMFTAPQAGVYTVNGLGAFTLINSVTVTPNQPMVQGGQQFTITNFTTDHSPNADAAGILVLRIGADAQTSGDGNGYPAGPYTGQFDIEVDY